MGVKERQEREREAVARAILDAARELFVAEGYQNVSIRKIAEKIEYSPAAIYSYFPSKDDIFLALAEEGFRLLFACGQDAAAGDRRSDRQHPCGVPALLRVQQDTPRVFRADVRRPLAFRRSAATGSASVSCARCEETMAAGIQSVIDAGGFPPGTSRDAVFRILMAAVHGVAVMRLCERLAPGEDADALARDTLEAALDRAAGRHHPYVSFLRSCD